MLAIVADRLVATREDAMQTDHLVETATKKIAAKPAARAKATKTKTLTVKKSAERSSDDLNSMIATAAYFHAERRGFEPGHELEDWLAAEQQVRTHHVS
jgi:hypothetical protein